MTTTVVYVGAALSAPLVLAGILWALWQLVHWMDEELGP